MVDTLSHNHTLYLLLLPQNLNKLAELVRGELPKLVRSIIGALITIDVHARDIVSGMVLKKVSHSAHCDTVL